MIKQKQNQLAEQMGLSLANCRKVMTACIQSVAMVGLELRWKGDQTRDTIGQANELQLLVNQEACATTGCFRTTNLGDLSMESGLRPAAAQLENRQRRFGLQLLSLSPDDQGRELVDTPTAIGRRLTNALAFSGKMESTVQLEEPETLNAELLQGDEVEAKSQEEKQRPGLATFTDGSSLTHTGHNQEAHDAEYAALAGALETATRREMAPERAPIFTDAQVAIKRMASEEPGPGQMYALQARKHIAALRRVRPDITAEIRWYPAHKGVPGNEEAGSGPSSRWRSQTPVGGGTRCHSPDLLRTSSERSWRRSGSLTMGWRLAARSTRC